MARPEKYKAEYAKQAKLACKLGATDEDLCELFSVCRRTISYWKIKHKAFLESLELGKEPADNRVEAALYHRAIGYSHPDTDIRVIDYKIVETPITKHYPPDTKAALAWLYNRRPDSWRPNPDGGGGDNSDLIALLNKMAEKLPD